MLVELQLHKPQVSELRGLLWLQLGTSQPRRGQGGVCLLASILPETSFRLSILLVGEVFTPDVLGVAVQPFTVWPQPVALLPAPSVGSWGMTARTPGYSSRTRACSSLQHHPSDAQVSVVGVGPGNTFPQGRKTVVS